IFTQLLTGIKIISFEQSPRTLELLVGEVILVVEMRDLVVYSHHGSLGLVRRRHCCNQNRTDISLGVIAEVHSLHETRVNQVALKTRVRLAQNEREDIGRIGS